MFDQVLNTPLEQKGKPAQICFPTLCGFVSFGVELFTKKFVFKKLYKAAGKISHVFQEKSQYAEEKPG